MLFEEWAKQFTTPQPSPPTTLQPGIGVPTEIVDTALASPDPVPPPYAAPADVPQAALPPIEAPSTSGELQPGLGIPQTTVDSAFQSPAPSPAEAPPANEIQIPDSEGTDFAAITDPERQQIQARDLLSTAEQDPEQYAMLRAQHELAAQHEEAAARSKAAVADAQNAEEHARIFSEGRKRATDAMAAVESDARLLDDEKIDPWADISTPRRIASVVGAIIGGLVQARSGGTNQGLAAVEHMIDQNIELQKVNLANKRAGISERRNAASRMYDQSGDEFRATEAIRVASWDSAIKGIEAQALNYDPNGTAAYKLADIVNAAREKRAEAIASMGAAERKAFEENEKRKLEFVKLQQEQLKIQEAARHNKAAEKVDASRAGADWLRAKNDALRAKTDAAKDAPGPVYSPAQLAQLYPGNPTPPIPMDQRQYKSWLESSKTGTEVVKATGDVERITRENSADERARQLGAGDLVDTSGKPLLFRNPESATRIATRRAATDNVARLIDQIEIARKKYGWSSDLMRSDEWRAAQADMGSLIIEGKTVAELGALSGPDMDLIRKALGTGDPTEMRDPIAGLKQARSNAIGSLNTMLRSEAAPKVTPKPYAPPKLQELKSEELSQVQNYDVWDSPLLTNDTISPEIRKRAAADAIAAADKLARDSDVWHLKVLAGDVANRVSGGLYSQEQGDKAMASIRREFARRVKSADPETVRKLGGVIVFGMGGPSLSDEQVTEWLARPIAEDN